MTLPVPFTDLDSADLVVDAEYESGTAGTAADDPLARLLPVGNQGGFRYSGSPLQDSLKLVVLYSSGADPDWPDALDELTGSFTYYGDNKAPGADLHATSRQGNRILRDAFSRAASPADRAKVPPFLYFERTGDRRNVRFRGLLVPGHDAVPSDEQLVAIWRSRAGQRFQNYRAVFTVLDAPVVSRKWLSQVLAGTPSGGPPPAAWTAWSASGARKALVAPPTLKHRSRQAQLPSSKADLQLLEIVRSYFGSDPVAFERCAAALWRMVAPAVASIQITRPTRDGGRDAVGSYALGPHGDPVLIDFALEAKCYSIGNAVGVREMSRLISRLRHRQFGVLVTTSYVHEQAYREVREDGHPVVILAGVDLVAVLKSRGYSTATGLLAWLQAEFPVGTSSGVLPLGPPASTGAPDLTKP